MPKQGKQGTRVKKNIFGPNYEYVRCFVSLTSIGEFLHTSCFFTYKKLSLNQPTLMYTKSNCTESTTSDFLFYFVNWPISKNGQN